MIVTKKRILLWLITNIVLGMLGLGVAALLLGYRLNEARAATTVVQQGIKSKDPQKVCTALGPAVVAWERTALLSRPLRPFLEHLGFIPRIGGDLVALPPAVELALQGSSAANDACTLLMPAWQASPLPERIEAVVRSLSSQPQRVAMIASHIDQAAIALDQLLPRIGRSTVLSPYRAQLQHAHDLAPQLVDSTRMVQQLSPELPRLLGLDKPQTYLLALQNPFEIRATGGFIGLVCELHLDRARPTIQHCQASEAYDIPAPPERPMPSPYARYLRLGGWYLRDANWSPDFPTTAQTLQWFWQLNKQPAVDGVVALDLYALPVLVNTFGVSLDDTAQSSSPEQAINEFLERYYSGTRYRDKAGISQMLPHLLDRAIGVDPGSVLTVAGAWQRLVTERHLLIAVNNPVVAQWLSAVGWDGGLQSAGQHRLRIVETDVGYGGVNAFVERLTHYDVALDATGAPLTATLTLTFTNQYSPWAEFPTGHAVYGNCTNPHTLKLERRTGCYAPYIRVYAPEGSRLLSQDGLEESYAPDSRYGRAVFGGYVRIDPGEQRVVQFRYHLPTAARGPFVFEKQPGTDDLPILLTFHSAGQTARVWARARTDLVYNVAWSEHTLTLSGVRDQTASAPFTASAAFNAGLEAWLKGSSATAVKRWQTGAAISRVLDYARLLAGRGRDADALAILAAVKPLATDGRAAYEEAVVLEARGERSAADQLYRDAAQRSPTHPLPVFQWQRHLIAEGQPTVPLVPDAWSASATRHWREMMYRVQDTATVSETLPYMQVLLQLTPTDRSVALNVATLLTRTGQTAAALDRLTALVQTDDLWGRLASAQRAQVLGQPAEAIVAYKRALLLASTYAATYDIADRLRDLGSTADADRAEQQAAALLPNGVTTLISEGDRVRDHDPNSALRWYNRALRLDPTSGAPDFAQGRLWYDEGSLVEAEQALEHAVAKAPGNAAYRDLLAQVRHARSAGSSSP